MSDISVDTLPTAMAVLAPTSVRVVPLVAQPGHSGTPFHGAGAALPRGAPV